MNSSPARTRSEGCVANDEWKARVHAHRCRERGWCARAQVRLRAVAFPARVPLPGRARARISTIKGPRVPLLLVAHALRTTRHHCTRCGVAVACHPSPSRMASARGTRGGAVHRRPRPYTRRACIPRARARAALAAGRLVTQRTRGGVRTISHRSCAPPPSTNAAAGRVRTAPNMRAPCSCAAGNTRTPAAARHGAHRGVEIACKSGWAGQPSHAHTCFLPRLRLTRAPRAPHRTPNPQASCGAHSAHVRTPAG